MICENCGSGMSGGAPHCETIKVQMECHSCGSIGVEYYTPEEQTVNRLLTATAAGFPEVRAALEQSGGDEVRAERIIRENYLDCLCRKFGVSGADFAQNRYQKKLGEVTNAGLALLTLAAQQQRCES